MNRKENIKNMLKENNVRGFFSMMEDGKYFSIDMSGDSERRSGDSEGSSKLFMLGSICSLYHNFLAIILFQSGKINIYNKISMIDERLPSYISIHDLIVHDSGANDIFDKNVRRKEFDESVSKCMEFIFANNDGVFDKNKYGKHFYSYTNYIIFVYLIEKIFEKNYKSILKQEIVDLMSLKYFQFISDGGGAWQTPITPVHDIVTTPKELLNFIIKMNSYLSETFLRMFYIIHDQNMLNHNLYYAMSGDIYRNEGGSAGDGRTYLITSYPGFKSSLGIDIKETQKRNVIFLSNDDEKGTIKEIAKYVIILIATGHNFYLKPKEPVPMKTEEIKALEGMFKGDKYYNVTKISDSELVLTGKNQINRLIHMGNRIFFKTSVELIKFPDNNTMVTEYITGEKFVAKKKIITVPI